MARDEYEIVDDGPDADEQDDGEGLTATLGERNDRAQKHSKNKSDAELFDDLPNGIKFKDETPPEDEDDALDEEDDDNRGNRADPDEDDEDQEGDLEDAPRQRRGESKDKFQRRLMRERRLRQEAEEDARTSQEAYTRLESKLDAFMAGQNVAQTTAELDRKIDASKAKLVDVRAQLLAATEAGETAKVIDLTEKMTDLKAEIRQAEADKSTAKATADKATEAAKVAKAAPQQNRHLTRWMRQHGQSYRTDPVFKAAAEAADKQLATSGSNPNTELHFEELNKILAKRFPEEFPHIKAGKKALNRNRAPIGGGEDEAPTGQRRRTNTGDIEVKGNKARLTGRHLKIMRDFGLDPESPNDVAAFVRENAPRKNRGR